MLLSSKKHGHALGSEAIYRTASRSRTEVVAIYYLAMMSTLLDSATDSDVG